jgi:hypothetical protein
MGLRFGMIKMRLTFGFALLLKGFINPSRVINPGRVNN